MKVARGGSRASSGRIVDLSRNRKLVGTVSTETNRESTEFGSDDERENDEMGRLQWAT